MAKVAELDEGNWKEWLSTRPQIIRSLAERWPPDRLYCLTTTGQRCTIVAYAEDGTIRVSITGQFNAIAFDREVFGVDPHDLFECALPAPHESLGAAFDELTYASECNGCGEMMILPLDLSSTCPTCRRGLCEACHIRGNCAVCKQNSPDLGTEDS